MQNKSTLLKDATLIGLISGLFLGFGFKLAEQLTGNKVYTLLLNVSFIPGFGSDTPEYIEFALHLLASILIAFIFVLAIQHYRSPWLCGITLGILAAFLYIPLSLLSQQGPTLSDFTAITYWAIGHLLYGLLLGLLGWLKLKSP